MIWYFCQVGMVPAKHRGMNMKMVFESGREVTLPNGFDVNISGKTFAFAWSNYPDNAIEHLVKYGPTQNLNDGHALPKGASPIEHYSKAMKRNDALLAGTFRQHGVGPNAGLNNPVRVNAINLALITARKTEADPDKALKAAIALVATNPIYLATAQKAYDDMLASFDAVVVAAMEEAELAKMEEDERNAA